MSLMPCRRFVFGRALLLLLLTACHGRVEQRPYSSCGFVPRDPQPPGPIVSRSSGVAGELRVRAKLRTDSAYPYMVKIGPIDSEQALFGVVTDSVAIFRNLPTGRYKVRVQALAYSGRSLEIDFAADSGRVVEIPLRYGGMSMCHDGVDIVRRSWWSFW